MCGIAGMASLAGGQIDECALRRMLPPLRHRGPDGTGVHVERGVGLGHTRLSIVDLAGGAQPIHNETGDIWVSFNGEIFNYLELRAELQDCGHQFYTHTDTEVIVHAYEQYGDDFVQHLNGQFAIALWDRRRRRLLLVRDRPGILPLFYTVSNGQLLFASEVKALLPALEHVPALDPLALDQLFTFWAPVAPRTMFEGIQELRPGHMLLLECGQLSERAYWDWHYPCDGDYAEGGSDRLAEQLHALLADATRIRLRADVPVGAYLSGGLDSSALVALIRSQSSAPFKTFSIGFEDKGLDESEHQRRLVEYLGVDHHRTVCHNADIGRDFYDTIYFSESPVLRTAPVPMRQLSALVRAEGYKVVLTGEGSDEVLGGYDIFKEAKIRQFWARYPQSGWRPLLLKRLYPWLNTAGPQAASYLSNFYGVGLSEPGNPGFSHLTRWQTTAQCKQFFSPAFAERLGASAESTLYATLPAAFGRWHPFNRGQYLEAKTLMAGYLLNAQGDRMLMANSVEGRFPFLDHRVIDFASRLPPALKMRVLNEKYLLKQAMRGRLPESILARHKQPYRAPDIPAFFGSHTPVYVNELLSGDTIKKYGYFDARKVELLVSKSRAGRAIAFKDNMALVGILSTQIWHQIFIEGFSQFRQAGNA